MLTSQETEKRERLRLSKPLVFDKIIRYEERYARGESVAVIQLQYNYICNMKCVHCSISSFQKQSGRTMTPADVKNLCDQADEYGLAQLDLTGGEPLAFKDLDEVIKAIDPRRFFLMCDTNGWLMTEEKVRHLKDLGVDKIQLSLDSMDAKAHDDFRRKPGAWMRAIKAIDAVNKVGLFLQISTVLTNERVLSDEFVDFLEFCKSNNASVNAIWAKPVGEYAGRMDTLVAPEVNARIIELRGKYDLGGMHTMKHFGVSYGCIAVKKLISITAYGDVMPCIWMYYSLGNIFDTPLRDILEKGMKIFGDFYSVCRMSESPEFVARYNENTKGKHVPVNIDEVNL